MQVWDIWLASTFFLKVLLYISSFMASGSMLFFIILKPIYAALEKNLLMVALTAALSALIITGAMIPLQAGQMLDSGISGMIDKEMLHLIAQGPLGLSSMIRIVGLLALIGGVFFMPIRLVLIPLGAVLVAVSFTLIGHATQNAILLGSLLTIHLLAVSYWVGGLWPLYRLLSARETTALAGPLAHRFGVLAQWIVPFLIITGLICTALLLGSFQALFSSTYGWVLIGKVITVSLLFSLAAFNKMRAVPALLKGNEKAAYHLKLSIRCEAGAFLMIFAITAILTSAISLPE